MPYIALLCAAAVALKDRTLLCLPKGKKDTFVLSNKVIQNDGHSCTALCHNEPDEPDPSRLTTFPSTSLSLLPMSPALITKSPPEAGSHSVFSFYFAH